VNRHSDNILVHALAVFVYTVTGRKIGRQNKWIETDGAK